jgi:DNA-binding transcriptional ArsR family regulator
MHTIAHRRETVGPEKTASTPLIRNADSCSTEVSVLQPLLYRCVMAVTLPSVGDGAHLRPDEHVDALHRVGRALSDPTRCRILLCLLDGPHYPTELATHLDLSKAKISNHLACLRGCGLVVTVQEGRRQRYELAHPALAHALTDMVGLSQVIDDTCELNGVGSREDDR